VCSSFLVPCHFICSPLSRSETPIAVMKGHQDRICRVAFHPSGNYVASASFDTTWRLWDINTSKEILLQEGHSREVYAVEFQDDGALAASAYVIFLLFINPHLFSFTVVLMPLAACGTCEQVEQRWSLTATSKAYLPWPSLLMGTPHSLLSCLGASY
jgi:hypothetical protein